MLVLNIRSYSQNLGVKANRALFAINRRYSLNKLPINLALKLFDSLIVPILLYGCEVWGLYEDFDLLKWDKTDIEKVHTQFLKRLLGVNVSTTNIMIRAEIWRYPLKINVDAKTVGFIKHINEQTDYQLSKLAYVYEKQIADKCNIPNIFRFLHKTEEKMKRSDKTKSTDQLNKVKIKDVLKAQYLTSWRECLNKTNKSLTFRQYKDNIKPSPYLQHVSNRKHRRVVAKFRLSDHNLEIGKGRHTKPKIDPQNRICKMCNLSRVEDEVHFLTECDQYKSERASPFKDMKQLHFTLNTDLKNETFKI